MKKKSLFHIIITIAIMAAATIADQLTKWLAVQYLKPLGSVSLLKFGETQWLNLTYCENTGMSFSLFEGHRLLLIGLPVILIGVVLWFIFSGKAKETRFVIALAFLAGGGLGNLIDRVFLGYVVDFIDFRIINFAIFNVADICAVLGGIAFGIMVLVQDIREEKSKKAAESEKSEAAVKSETADNNE